MKRIFLIMSIIVMSSLFFLGQGCDSGMNRKESSRSFGGGGGHGRSSSASKGGQAKGRSAGRGKTALGKPPTAGRVR